MKRLLTTALMTAMCCLSGCAQSAYRRVGVEGFEAALGDSALVLVDVRTAEEFAEGHIPGAKHFGVMGRAVVAALPRGTRLAIYCRSGGRSRQAASILRKQGYPVVELSSGFHGWVSAGKPIDRSK